jgi:hypothetical protein
MTFIIDGTNGETFPDSTTQSTSALVAGKVPYSTLPAGSVLQVVQTAYNTILSTTSTSYVTTGLSASITPKFSTSKIVATVNMPSATLNNAAQNTITVFRGATNLGISGGAQQGFNQLYNAAGQGQCSLTACYLDSPATTSSTTYTVYFASTNGGTVQVFNNQLTGTMILMEIAG